MENEQSASDAEIADAEIAKEALTILKAPGQQGKLMLMSYLGSKLSGVFSPSPWRTVLGARSLHKVLEKELRDQIVFEGTGSQIYVQVAAENDASEPQRFDKIIWAAFAKPIPSGCRRVLYPLRPFKFSDQPGDTLTLEAGSYEVEPHLVPDASVPRLARDRAIAENIKQWCSLQKIEVARLIESNNPEATPHPRAITPTASPGLLALERLIAAIPVGERKNYSFPLDLLHRLISSN